MRISQTILVLVSLFIYISSPAKSRGETEQTTDTLRVALFPYIPDAADDNFSALESAIKASFEKKYPKIYLSLRHMDPSEDFYDDSTVVSWLTEKSGYDLVEIDALLLDKIAGTDKKIISAWPESLKTGDWHPAAKQAATMDGKIYGFPHLLCGYFIFSKNKNIARSKNGSELVKSLQEAKTDHPNFLGNFKGSWTLPTIYMDMWEDIYHQPSVEKAIFADQPDVETMSYLKQISAECRVGEQNPCLSGLFADDGAGHFPDSPAIALAHNNCDAIFGYSETLHEVLKNDLKKDAIFLESAPWGAGNNPVLFTDVVVLRNDASERTRNAAIKFMNFLTSPATNEMLMMSHDVKNKQRVPRYVIPASGTAFNVQSVKNDKYYTRIKDAIETGIAYPNKNYPGNRKRMQTSLIEELKQQGLRTQ